MKQILMLVVLISLSTHELRSQNENNMEETVAEIKKTVEAYFVGTRDGDIEALKTAFHPDCKIYSIDDDGELTFLTQPQFHQVVLDNYQKARRHNQILSLEFEGNTAMVKSQADYPSFGFMDYLTILNIKGTWKIVSKSTQRFSK